MARTFFTFADDDTFTALMTQAGLIDARVTTVQFSHRFDSVEALWDGLMSSTVRTRETVLGHPPNIQRLIRTAFEILVDDYRHADHLDVPVAAKIAPATKLLQA